MATNLKGAFVTCLLLFVILMEEAKPVVALKITKKRLLKERVDILEGIMDKVQEQLKVFEECQACSMLKELNETINELQEKVDFKPTAPVDPPAGLEKSEILDLDASYLTDLGDFLKPVMQCDTQWKRCWQASVDGWEAKTFHSLCDDKGPTVTIVRVGEYIFGGYTNRSWGSSNCTYKYDSAAFIFSLVNKPGWQPVKLDQTGKNGFARAHSIEGCSRYGPTFGKYDLHIANLASSNTKSFSSLGYTYRAPTGYSYLSDFARSFLAGIFHFQPDEVEVFYGTA